MICGIYFTGRDICIGKISFQPVPFRVSLKFVVIDGHLNVALHLQELVITSLVYVVFRQGATLVCLFQTLYPLFPVVGILAGTVVCISHKQTSAASLVVFHHLLVNFGLTEYPFLYPFAFVLDFRTDNIFVTVCFQVCYIVAVHQSGVGYDNKVFQFIFPYKFRHYRQHRVTFILVPFMYAISQRIASDADEQSEDDLWIPVPSFFGKSCLSQFIFIIRLKIKSGHIIEQNTDAAVQHLPCMQYAYILDNFMLTVAELVQITVYLRQTDILIEMVFQVLGSSRLACRIGQPRLYQLSEHRILDPVEAHTVKHTVKYQVCPVNRYVGNT